MKRSNLLTHWTGKDICTDLGMLTEAHRKQYLARLMSVLDGGFWMTTPDEAIHGWSPDPEKIGRISYQAPRSCFTELRVTDASLHSARYGSLGFVVDRTFVLDHWGSPVMYLRNHPQESIVGNFKEVMSWIARQPETTADLLNIHSNLAQIAAYMKSMSNFASDDFAYLDENEWRIVHHHQLETDKKIVPTNTARPQFKVPIALSDLRFLVAPDALCRDMFLTDPGFLAWKAGANIPIITVEESLNL
jgi:hypothetical protein